MLRMRLIEELEVPHKEKCMAFEQEADRAHREAQQWKRECEKSQMSAQQMEERCVSPKPPIERIFKLEGAEFTEIAEDCVAALPHCEVTQVFCEVTHAKRARSSIPNRTHDSRQVLNVGTLRHDTTSETCRFLFTSMSLRKTSLNNETPAVS
jgi:hypothetical protein